MNIFALSDSPFDSARWQHDRHVVKMTLETAQLLSTAVWHDKMIQGAWVTQFPLREGLDGPDAGSFRLYKASHANHPCAVWVRETDANFIWTVLHLNGLIGEYHRRFLKVHGCDIVRHSFNRVAAKMLGLDRILGRSMGFAPEAIELASQHQPFVYCGPEVYRGYRDGQLDPIDSYQRLYLQTKIFQDHVKWTRCDDLPPFIKEARESYDERVAKRVGVLSVAHSIQEITTFESSYSPRIAKPAYDPATDSRPTLNVIKRFGVKSA
jgi:hypothetical protein